MKYFLYADTGKRAIMRFFDSWVEIVDFFDVMHWKLGETDFPVHVYNALDVSTKIE